MAPRARYSSAAASIEPSRSVSSSATNGKKAFDWSRAILQVAVEVNKRFIRVSGCFLVALISSIIISASFLFFTQLLPLIGDRLRSRFWHHVHWMIGFMLSWQCGVNFWSAVLICPGKLYPSPNESGAALVDSAKNPSVPGKVDIEGAVVDGSGGGGGDGGGSRSGSGAPSKGNKYCAKCCAERPARSHHCKICKACVLLMDHHCPFVNNCVGRHNYRFFVLTLFWTTVTCTYGVFITTGNLLHEVDRRHVLLDKEMEELARKGAFARDPSQRLQKGSGSLIFERVSHVRGVAKPLFDVMVPVSPLRWSLAAQEGLRSSAASSPSAPHPSPRSYNERNRGGPSSSGSDEGASGWRRVLLEAFGPVIAALRLLYGGDPQVSNLFMGVTSLFVGIPVATLFSSHLHLVRTAQTTIEQAAQSRALKSESRKATALGAYHSPYDTGSPVGNAKLVFGPGPLWMSLLLPTKPPFMERRRRSPPSFGGAASTAAARDDAAGSANAESWQKANDEHFV